MMRHLSGYVVAALLLGITACESSPRHDSTTMRPGIDIQSVARQVMTGDTVTFSAHTYDTYGRDARVEWSTTAGTLSTEQEGRVARVQFDESGTYSVKAELLIDGAVVDTDLVEVRVRPVG